MVVRRKSDNKDRWVGLSTDQKPSNGVDFGSLFREENTGDIYFYNGIAWVLHTVGSASTYATKVTHNASQNVTAQQDKILSFNTVLFGSQLSNGDRLIIPEAGLWLIQASVEVDGNLTNLIQGYISKGDGDTLVVAAADGNTNRTVSVLNMDVLERCVAGDFYRVHVFNNHASTTVQAVTGDHTPLFSITKLV